jgi:hypothetical protein
VARADFADGSLMILGLSSAAVTGASIGELADICAARGLGAIELRLQDLDAVDAIAWSVDAVATIAGCYSEASAGAAELVEISRRLGAPIIVADDCSIEIRIRRARAIDGAGGRSLVLTRGPAAAWYPAVSSAGIDYAWEVDAAAHDIVADTDALLRTPQHALRYIRIIGGGPEAVMHEGRGIGPLMSRLALAGFDGAVILTPSSPRYRLAWAAWLGRRGGWGCGSKAAASALTALPLHNPAGDDDE